MAARRGSVRPKTAGGTSGEAAQPAADPAGQGAPAGSRPAVPAEAAGARQDATPQTQEAPGSVQSADQAQEPAGAQVAWSPQSEEEKFLFARRSGFPVHPMQGLTRALQPAPPPELLDQLPLFKMAAEMPDSPPQMRAILEMILFHANQGQGAR